MEQGRKNGNQGHASTRHGGGKNRYGESHPKEIATAPYNFVPLPERVLPSPLNQVLDSSEGQIGEAFQQYLEQGSHVSGHIELKITSLTPLFLGTGSATDSFAPMGRPLIPGSSLRGLIKNLYKMITCGVWRDREDTTDCHLYYRCLMSSKDSPYNRGLHDAYQHEMTNSEWINGKVKIKKNPLPGFIVKRKGKWFIYPLLRGKLRSIPIFKYLGIFHLNKHNDLKKSQIRWSNDGRSAFIQTGILKPKEIKMTQEELDATTEYNRKRWGKQYFKVLDTTSIDKAQNHILEIPQSVIEEYEEDRNADGVRVLKDAVENDARPRKIEGIEAFDGIAPCFYLLDNLGNVKSFGHGQSYRIPYHRSIMDAVNAEVRRDEKNDLIDFTDAVFGRGGDRKLSWASRVMFDDATAVSKICKSEAKKAQMLMEPKPTSFQLYLKQRKEGNLIFWDSTDCVPEIRGYKMYWHSAADHKWMAESSNEERKKSDKKTSNKIIAPLSTGSQFQGNIRFQDLTPEELGALLKVFYLAENHEKIAFKIGMGKSIGLGSILIEPTLYIEDGSRYRKLFDPDGWHDSEKLKNPISYISAYEKYVKEARKGIVWPSYENTLRVLRQMLDYNNTNLSAWERGTAQMAGPKDRDDKRFERRNILPTASEVIQKIKEQER